MPSKQYPITAIIIYRNEKHLLKDCLEALYWCDEIITIDMQSTDGSACIANQYSNRQFEVEPYPIAEPTRVAAAKLAKNDWIFYVDPDELIPPSLAADIINAIESNPQAGVVQIPIRFYFKRKILTGTVWGTPTHVSKIANRKRASILPLCNRLMEPHSNYHTYTIPHRPDNHMIHLWSDSLRNLAHRHLIRYPHLEAKAKVARGERYSHSLLILESYIEFKKCFKDFDGWRLGFNGWALSFIYLIYTILSVWYMRRYQDTISPNDTSSHAQLPTLKEVTPSKNTTKQARFAA